MIQMYYLTNFKVLLHFFPEIHLEINPLLGSNPVFWTKVIQIPLTSFEQHKLKV